MLGPSEEPLSERTGPGRIVLPGPGVVGTVEGDGPYGQAARTDEALEVESVPVGPPVPYARGVGTGRTVRALRTSPYVLDRRLSAPWTFPFLFPHDGENGARMGVHQVAEELLVPNIAVEGEMHWIEIAEGLLPGIPVGELRPQHGPVGHLEVFPGTDAEVERPWRFPFVPATSAPAVCDVAHDPAALFVAALRPDVRAPAFGTRLRSYLRHDSCSLFGKGLRVVCRCEPLNFVCTTKIKNVRQHATSKLKIQHNSIG